MSWFNEITEMEKSIIAIQLENNGYYSLIRKDYKTSKNKDEIIEGIYDLYESFNCYYSIYAIMDSIEECMRNYNESSIIDAINNDGFIIKDY